MDVGECLPKQLLKDKHSELIHEGITIIWRCSVAARGDRKDRPVWRIAMQYEKYNEHGNWAFSEQDSIQDKIHAETNTDALDG